MQIIRQALDLVVVGLDFFDDREKDMLSIIFILPSSKAHRICLPNGTI